VTVEDSVTDPPARRVGPTKGPPTQACRDREGRQPVPMHERLLCYDYGSAERPGADRPMREVHARDKTADVIRARAQIPHLPACGVKQAGT
jgi:hypothetical protein